MASLPFSDIEIGKKYEISLDTSAKFVTLQYLFKPISIADQKAGEVQSVGTGSTVDVTIESRENIKESFKGTKREFSEANHEYVLMMDKNKKFKMVKVDKSYSNLRVQRAENIFKSKEASSKESKQLLESKKLPKFLQKPQRKKTNPVVSDKTEEKANNDISERDYIEMNPEQNNVADVNDSVDSLL